MSEQISCSVPVLCHFSFSFKCSITDPINFLFAAVACRYMYAQNTPTDAAIFHPTS